MTDEEIRTRTQEKVNKIKALCMELQVSIGAKTRITPDMFVEPTVIFTDEENYPVITRGPEEGEEAPTVIPENEQPAKEETTPEPVAETPNESIPQ